MRAVVLLCLVAVASATILPPLPAGSADDGDYMPVPGGLMLHKSCVHEVPDGYVVDGSVPRAPCKFPARQPNAQIYAIDTHFSSSANMQSFNASFNVPGLPPQLGGGQINYFWPGFKSTEPTMGLPVLQPVLQYGTDSKGGGQYWCVRSWFVYGNIGEAFVSPLVRINANDKISSYMDYISSNQTWIIYAKNLASGQDTTLRITRSQVHNTDFKVAMLVLETIMPANQCRLLPGNPTSVTFTGVSVNKQTAPWVKRVPMHDCGQDVSVSASGDVAMTWHN